MSAHVQRRASSDWPENLCFVRIPFEFENEGSRFASGKIDLCLDKFTDALIYKKANYSR
jgi:hypothetical protein